MAAAFASTLLPAPSVKVSHPLALLFFEALEWIEMKRSAFASLAMLARCTSGICTSVVRVNIILTSGYFSFTMSAKSFDTLRFTSFSFALLPNAPGSTPPCPGSMTMVNGFSLPFCFFCAGLAVATKSSNSIINVCLMYIVLWFIFFLVSVC